GSRNAGCRDHDDYSCGGRRVLATRVASVAIGSERRNQNRLVISMILKQAPGRIDGGTQARLLASTSSGHSNSRGAKSSPDGDAMAAVRVASGVWAGPNGRLAAIT